MADTPESPDAPWWPAFTALELAELAGVHVTSARRWLRRREAPPHITRWLQLLHEGTLGTVSAAWRGWSVRGDQLVSPEGERFTPGDVRASRIDRDQVRELRRALQAATNTVMSSDDRRHLVRAIARLKRTLTRSARAGARLEELLEDQLADRERDELFELTSTAATRD